MLKIKKRNKNKKNVVGVITPVKKAFCATCKGMLVPSSELSPEAANSGNWYCPNCDKLY